MDQGVPKRRPPDDDFPWRDWRLPDDEPGGQVVVRVPGLPLAATGWAIGPPQARLHQFPERGPGLRGMGGQA